MAKGSGGGGSGPTVAKAYVAIIPTTKDAQKNISKSLIPEMEAASDDAGKAGGESLVGSLGSALSAGVSKVAAAAKVVAGAGVAALGVLTTAAYGAFSDWEQLEGGVAKIFDELDISTITQDAQEAYKTLGLSATQYMEAMTNVGATFASTLGDAKGYDVAKEGMQAISDYASGTGKNVDLLTEKYTLITRSASSYQSIADQFSGILPATGEAFVQQAYAAGYLSEQYEKVADVPLAEYQEALTHMLTDGVDALGLLGNTAREADTTLSGSMAQMAASWQNLLVAFGEGTPEAIKPAVDNLIASVGTWLSNAIPRIGIIISGIVSYIPTLAQDIISALPGMVSDISNALGEQIGTIDLGAMLQPVIDAAMENSLFASIVSFGGRIGEAFTQVFGEVDLAATFDTIRTAVETAMGVITQVITTAQDMLASFLGSIDTATIVAIMEGLKQIGEALIGVLVQIGGIVADVLVGLVWPTIQNIWGFVAEHVLPGIMTLWDTIQPGIMMVIDILAQVYDWISRLVSSLIEFLVPAFELIITTAGPIFDAIIAALSEVLSSVISVVGGIWDKIKPFIERLVADFSAFFSELGKWLNAVMPVVSEVAKWVGDKIGMLFRWLGDTVGGVIRGIGNIISGIIGVITGIVQTIHDLLTGNFDAVRDDIWGLISSIGQAFWGVVEIITSPFRSAFDAIKRLWNSTIGKLSFTVPDWVPGIGGAGFSMPKLASGGTIMQAGSVMVGEAGPEILTLPRGARVAPLRDADASAGTTYNVMVGDVNLSDDDEVRRITRGYLERLARLAQPGGVVMA